MFDWNVALQWLGPPVGIVVAALVAFALQRDTRRVGNERTVTESMRDVEEAFRDLYSAARGELSATKQELREANERIGNLERQNAELLREMGTMRAQLNAAGIPRVEE